MGAGGAAQRSKDLGHRLPDRKSIVGAVKGKGQSGSGVYGVAYSTDGNRLAYSRDGQVRIWGMLTSRSEGRASDSASDVANWSRVLSMVRLNDLRTPTVRLRRVALMLTPYWE